MEKLKSGLINAVFFVVGDLAYSIFFFQNEHNPAIFFGGTIVILLFFVLHKLDNILDKPSKQSLLREKKYTNWLLSAVIGLGFAFSSNGSTLLRWISR